MGFYEKVKGKTGCIHLKESCIPVYEISDDNWILIDSGVASDRDELKDLLEEHNVIVSSVLSSHAHIDHIGNHMFLRYKYHTEIIMTAFDAGMTFDHTSLKSLLYSNTGLEIEKNLPSMFVKADKIIAPGAKSVSIGNLEFEIIPLPGHAGSHIGFVTPDKVAYLADSLQSSDMLTWQKAPYMLDWTTAMETIKKIGKMSYPYFILAHHGVIQDIGKVADRYLAYMENCSEKIASVIDEPLTMDEITERSLKALDISVKTVLKARMVERIVREIVGCLVDKQVIVSTVKDGVLAYSRRNNEKTEKRRRYL